MHTSFDYVRRSRYSDVPIASGLTHKNALAEHNYANNARGGVGMDVKIQWHRAHSQARRTSPAGSGNGLDPGDWLDAGDWRYRAHIESYETEPELHLGPDLSCYCRRTRHSPLP